MKKLKSIDFKALFIDHGEKMGLGVIGFTVLLVLGLGTAWSRCPQTPDELKAKVAQANSSIDAPTNMWPKAKSEQYAVVDFTDKARDVFKGLEVSKYEFSTHLYWPLYRKKEKAKEPEYLAPQYLIASPGEAIIGVNTAPSVAPDALAAADDMQRENDKAVPDDYKEPAGGRQGAPGAGAGPMMTAGAHGGKPSATAGPSGGRPKPAPSGGHGAAGAPMYSSSGSDDGAVTPAVTARGVRYVAVRAIVPIKEQIEKAMRALNLPYADASAAIEYTDFVLERQAAVAGSDPWNGDWKPVDVATALEVLAESDDFDPDPVPADLQDAVITMALPYRLLKYWGDDATHPNIKNFQLSKEEMERETKLQAKLVEEYEKMQLEAAPKVKKKGLSAVQNDLRQMGAQIAKNTDGAAAMRSIQQSMMEGGGNRGQMGAQDVQARLTASGRLYLFRYFDFDVQPGMAYRYKVKLELRNPNFERPTEEVDDPAIVHKPYRETGFSNISNVAVVPESMHYYLKDVERDPSLDDKPSKKPVASIVMFEWDPKIGTMLSDTLKILSVGQFIADSKLETWVLDPSVPSFEKKKVPRAPGELAAFVTEDVLLDARGDLDLSPELHPDLALKSERGKKEVKIGMLQEALVVTATGSLRELDPVSESDEEQALKDRVTAERKGYLYLKDAPKDANAGDKDNAYAKMMGGGKSDAKGSGKKTSKSARKKKGAKATNSASGGMGSLPQPAGFQMPGRSSRGK